MIRSSKSVGACAALITVLAFATGCAQGQKPSETPTESKATQLLKARSEALKPTVTQVSKTVYCASGFTPANISMIVGKDGVVIVDAGMAPAHAQAVLKEFRKISALPVAAVILTHGHGDHTGGTPVFLNERKDGQKASLIVRAPFNTEGGHFARGGVTINRLRGARQGGFLLPPEKRINNGIAPAMYPPKKNNVFVGEPLRPNRTFTTGREKITVAGIDLELVAATGETTDQLYVWYPAERVVFTGDNFYRSWPNLYAIRGTAYRDVHAWVRSLDLMIAEGPDGVVPGHTLPVLGKKECAQTLKDYRDAINHIFTETVAGINRGLTPDELVYTVRLPAELAAKDYIREYYGNVEWGVRAIYAGYLGWFDGNPTNLFSLSLKDEAEKTAELAGGADKLLARARIALKESDAQWCAQLCDHLIALNPKDPEALTLKAEALEVLAENLLTATGRNYYLTVAQELRAKATR